MMTSQEIGQKPPPTQSHAPRGYYLWDNDHEYLCRLDDGILLYRYRDGSLDPYVITPAIKPGGGSYITFSPSPPPSSNAGSTVTIFIPQIEMGDKSVKERFETWALVETKTTGKTYKALPLQGEAYDKPSR